MRKELQSKPHEALQSLSVTTCSQPWVGFKGCTLCNQLHVHLATLKIHSVSETPPNFKRRISLEVVNNSRNEATSLARIPFLFGNLHKLGCQHGASAWLSTDWMFTPGHSKASFQSYFTPDKYNVSCVVADSHSWSEEKLFFPTAIAVSMEFL